jgi:hypothetical protein
MKKLIVLTNNDKTSARIKKEIYIQISNFEISFASISNIPIRRNCVYLILKNIHLIHSSVLKTLKKNKNKIIYEILDGFHKVENLSRYIKMINRHCFCVNSIICNNLCHAKYIESNIKQNIKTSVVYHHADSKLSLHSTRCDDVYYIGSLSKQSLSKDQIAQYKIKLFTPFKKNHITNIVSGIHIDFVLPDKSLQYTIHTTTKLATAFYTRSVFICNRQPVYTELIGEDYELYINDDLSNLETVIQNAKQIFNTEGLLDAYFEKYNYVQEKVSITACIDMYSGIFS